MRDTLLIIHILAAGTWIGGSMAVTYLNRRLRAKGHETGAAFMKAFEQMGRTFYPPAAIVVLITGILLVVDSDVYAFEDAFVVIGIATVIAGAVLGTRVFSPIARRAIAAHEDGDDGAAAGAYRRFSSFALLDLAILVFAVVAMVAKFGA